MDPGRLHPQARAALGAQLRAPLSRDNLVAVRRSMRDAVPAEVGDGPALATVVTVDAGGVAVRLYRDGNAEPVPVVLFAHGGGWVMGDLETHDGLCRHLAAASGWAVVAVDYRLAPEHPYPAAFEDAERALTWVRDAGADEHRLDPARIAVAGDSSGGHLAAVLARRARDAGTDLAGQILVCPVIDPDPTYPPLQEPGPSLHEPGPSLHEPGPSLDEYGLGRDEMRFFWDAFAPPGVDRSHPDLDPLRADLTGLPPAAIITAELDLLRDEGERYAAALTSAGVPVVSVRYQGLIHNFPRKLALFDAAHVAVAQLAAALTRWR